MHSKGRGIAAGLMALVCVLAFVLVFAPAGRELSGGTVPSSSLAARISPDGDDGQAQDAVEAPAVDEGAADAGEAATAPDEAPPYESGVVLVSLADSVSADEALKVLREQTGIADLSIEGVSGSVVKVAFSSDLSVEDAVEAVSSASVVEAAQPNYAYYPAEDSAASPGTGLLAASDLSLFALTPQAANDPWPSGTDWHLKKIGAYDAWDHVNALPASSKRVVTVAVIDVGFNLAHEDMVGNYVADPQGGGTLSTVVDPYNAYEGREGASSISTTLMHGTHIAGIIAAHANNAMGVAGATGNLVRIMPIQAFSSNGTVTYTDTLLKGYSYIMSKASADNVRVINMSLGAGRAGNDWSKSDKLLFTEISKAYDKGVVTVAAACNRDTGNRSKYDDEVPFYCYPGDYGRCVTVINTNSSDARNSESNYNRAGQKSKDVSAPGTDILSTAYSGYRSSSGTSMATPVVSSVLALIFTVNPGLSADEAVSKLYSSATDIGSKGWDAQTGYGRVDALAAVRDGAYLSGTNVMFAGKPETYELNLPSGVETSSVKWSIDSTSGSVAKAQKGTTGATLTASGACEFILTASASGSDGKTYTASQTVSAFSARISGKSTLPIGEKGTYSVDGMPPVENSFTWSSSDTDVATISAAGVLTTRKEGTVVVTATDTASGMSFSKTVRISGLALSATNATVTGVVNRPYSGKPVAVQKPTVKRGGVTLKAGVDYVLTYRDAAGRTVASSAVKNVGTYYAVITGRGNYVGTLREPFKVVAPSVTYRAHVQDIGWQGWKRNGAKAGTTGRAMRMEAIKLKVSSPLVTGGIRYRAHVQDIGWQGWKRDGAKAGTTGRAMRMEALRIQLTGDMALRYDVYYRAHVQHFGWMGWAKNGARAGTAGYSYRLEAVQVKLVPKGMPAPASTSGAFRQR